MPGLAALLASELLRVARDRMTSRSPVPRDLGSITADWLGDAIGGRVTGVTSVGSTAGTTSRARLRLEGDSVPSTVFVKLAPNEIKTRMFVDLMGLGFHEAGFYRLIRPGLPIEAPRVHAIAEDRRLGRFALVLEDLVARGCRFTDVRTAPSPDEAAAVVSALARLHAHFWESPRFAADLSWVVPAEAEPNQSLIRALLRSAFRRVSRKHPDLIPAGARFLVERRPQIERAMAHGPATLLHGDTHFGNMYFDGDVPGLLDWQVVRRGPALRDLTYFLVLSVSTETRRDHQAVLLRAYLDELASAGGPHLSDADAWEQYRIHAAYAWVSAAFTVGAGALQAELIALTGLRRAAAALADLETLQAVTSVIG